MKTTYALAGSTIVDHLLVRERRYKINEKERKRESERKRKWQKKQKQRVTSVN